MLNGISWGQFTIFILVVTGTYYLYVWVCYFKGEAFGWMSRKEGTPKGKHEDQKADNDVKPVGEPGAATNQAELFEREGSGKGGNEQFQEMERAIAVIRQVIAQGIENKLDRENLLDHIREVLGDYRELRQTEYGETINNFLVRVCAGELSLELGEKELAGLWK